MQNIVKMIVIGAELSVGYSTGSTKNNLAPVNITPSSALVATS